VRTFAILTTVILAASSLAGCQSPKTGQAQLRNEPSPSGTYVADIRAQFSGERALETVALMDQYVRWPGNRGFDASVDHIVEALQAAGYVPEERASGEDLTYRVEEYPMDEPAWEPLGASVWVEGQDTPVLEWTTNRNMLARGSFGTRPGGVSAELVDVGDGSPEAFEALDVAGKIVIADMNVSRLFTAAVVERGAAGVLGHSLPDYLQPEVNRTSIQFGSIPFDRIAEGWGISLSRDAQERLRDALASGPVRVRVQTDVEWTENAVELTVVADARGQRFPDERFVFSAHIQEPGANDNASGVAAQLEMARVVANLVRDGQFLPGRTITFIWGQEIRSTARYIGQDEGRAAGIRWGLSLDMVGEDAQKTGGTFLVEKMPDPSAIWTRGEEKHTEWGGRALTKEDMTPHYFNDFVLQRALEQARDTGWVVKTNPFEGGSDHVPFLRADIPGLLLWHFTDQFYHTDGDRLEMVSAAEMKNVGVTALASAMTLVSADGETARSMVAEVAHAAVERLAVETALGVAALSTDGDEAPDTGASSGLDHESDILTTWADWYEKALESLVDVEQGGTSPETRTAIENASALVRSTLRRSLAELESGAAPSTDRP
jgi:aminopeptidase YwaD